MYQRILILLLLGIISATITAWPLSVKELGDRAYQKKEYDRAAELYEQQLKENPSADVYYNLGNIYFRLKQWGKSVLNYERALYLEPNHEDAQCNLSIVNRRLIDRFTPRGKTFLTKWITTTMNAKSIKGWVDISFSCLLFVIGFIILFRNSVSSFWRKSAFVGGTFVFVGFLLSSFFAFILRNQYENNNRAVVIAEVKTFSNPTEKSLSDIVLHEGTTVEIVERLQDIWLCAKLPDDKIVWLKKESIEEVAVLSKSKCNK